MRDCGYKTQSPRVGAQFYTLVVGKSILFRRVRSLRMELKFDNVLKRIVENLIRVDVGRELV